MEDGTLPFVSAADRESFLKKFAHLKKVMLHPALQDDDKIIWLWLATKCTSDLPSSCITSYAHISLCLDMRPRRVQDCLLRLLSTGFLIAKLPVHFGEPTFEMVQAVHEVRLKTPYLTELPQKKEREDAAFVKMKEEATVMAEVLQQEKEQKEKEKKQQEHAEQHAKRIKPKDYPLMQRLRYGMKVFRRVRQMRRSKKQRCNKKF